jgi:ribonucleoside-diphosphate reductase alpha chain
MGFHGYLQSKNIAWESWQAASENYSIFKDIKTQAVEATYQLAVERGECPDGVGYGVRNMHLLAIAPNANSSILCGCTASIEPRISNCYVHRTRAGSHTVRNPYLEEVLDAHGRNNKATWKSILESEGSVQHLDWLSDAERDAFKTAFELDQNWVVEHAAKRQEFICQGQSVNVFFPSGTDKAIVNQVHLKAWKEGLKGLYYLRTTSGVTAEKVGTKVDRNALKDFDGDECVSCQG